MKKYYRNVNSYKKGNKPKFQQKIYFLWRSSGTQSQRGVTANGNFVAYVQDFILLLHQLAGSEEVSRLVLFFQCLSIFLILSIKFSIYLRFNYDKNKLYIKSIEFST